MKFNIVFVVTLLLAQDTLAAGATSLEIAELYKTELGREQDLDGATFWKSSGLSVEEIREQFRKSDEYKNKNKPTPNNQPSTTEIKTSENFKIIKDKIDLALIDATDRLGLHTITKEKYLLMVEESTSGLIKEAQSKLDSGALSKDEFSQLVKNVTYATEYSNKVANSVAYNFSTSDYSASIQTDTSAEGHAQHWINLYSGQIKHSEEIIEIQRTNISNFEKNIEIERANGKTGQIPRLQNQIAESKTKMAKEEAQIEESQKKIAAYKKDLLVEFNRLAESTVKTKEYEAKVETKRLELAAKIAPIELEVKRREEGLAKCEEINNWERRLECKKDFEDVKGAEGMAGMHVNTLKGQIEFIKRLDQAKSWLEYNQNLIIFSKKEVSEVEAEIADAKAQLSGAKPMTTKKTILENRITSGESTIKYLQLQITTYQFWIDRYKKDIEDNSRLITLN